jgi:PAS domain S-box-containing protein
MMNDDKQWLTHISNRNLWIAPSVTSVALIILAQHSPLGFHTIAELFAIIISCIMFAFAWSTRRFSVNNYLLFLACGYVWISSLDLMHVLVYKGMDVFVEGNGNLGAQFWLSARYSEALLLLTAPFAASRKQNEYLLIIVFGATATGLTALALSGNFPTAFVVGKGLTDFKIYSEYLIIIVLTLALVTLHRFGSDIPKIEKTCVTFAIIFTMCAELAFTFYVDVFGLSNRAGHLLKIFSFWFLLKAVVISKLKRPYADLQESELRYRQMFSNNLAAFLIIDPEDGEIVNASYGACRYYGYSLPELTAMNIADINIMEKSDITAEITRAKDEERNFLNYRHRLASGEIREVEVYSSPIPVNGDSLLYSIVHDINDRKLLESDLKTRSDDLQKRIKEQACLY